MDLRQLRYFVVTCEELNFTRAAARCNMSQPPLSRAIAKLEEELSVRLFDRDKHNVSLTTAGFALLDDARRMLELAGDAQERARRVAAGLQGTLSIGFGGSPTYSLLPQLVRRFREAVPDVKILFRPMSVPQQLDSLRNGEIDVGIVRLPVHDELLATEFVYREPLVAALPSDHPALAEEGPIRIDRLYASSFVAYEPRRGFNYHADLQTLCRLAGFDPNIAYEAPTTESLIGIVACGAGVAIVPASAERLHLDGVTFRPLLLTDIPPHLGRVEFALAWLKSSMPRPVLEFLQHARTPAPD